MASAAASAPAFPVEDERVSALGRLLRQWRRSRGMSQLQLALAAGISSRHLSFVETGRAQAGRGVVLRLASALDLPLRDRNAALAAAGFAQIYGHGDLGSPAMAPVSRAIDFILRQQEPYPAMVMDRLCNVHRVNEGARRFLALFLPEEKRRGPLNLFRLLLAPDLFRPHIVNWEDMARIVVLRLRRGVIAVPPPPDASGFLDEMLSMPGLPDDVHDVSPDTAAPPVVATEFVLGDRHVRLFTAITTLGTPQDVTLQELAIESSFPADAETDAFLRSLAPR
jgi:transcriptional regulator with XRE-family HTH domain